MKESIYGGGRNSGKLEKMLQELKANMEELEQYRKIGTTEEIREAFAILIEMTTKLNKRWIPVEERLPEEEYYPALCVTNQNYYCVAVYNKTHGFRTGDIFAIGEIVAWRPLPKRYKPKRRD